MRTSWVLLLVLWAEVACANRPARIANSVPNQYIVMLKPDVDARSIRLPRDARILQTYDEVGGMLVETRANPELLDDPNVAYIQPNMIMRVSALGQPEAPWGLDRVDSRQGLDSKYVFAATGAGVNAYIVDTGIRSSHIDFTGRVGAGFSAVGGGTGDCHGHGTHVAGTVGGEYAGVAKDVTLIPVRVFGCQGQGTSDSVLQGLNWIMATARRPAVVNMSLGGAYDPATNGAVQRLTAAGITVVVAAGNSFQDACSSSPAMVGSAITVAASDRYDRHASFSNYGSCVDLYAPGVDIVSLYGFSDTMVVPMSGTSMASPHVAGAVALLLERDPAAAPSQIESKLKSLGTQGAIVGAPYGTPNTLLFTAPFASR